MYVMPGEMIENNIYDALWTWVPLLVMEMEEEAVPSNALKLGRIRFGAYNSPAKSLLVFTILD